MSPLGVRLSIQESHVVIDNGLLQVTLSNPDGSVTSLRYNNIDNLLEVFYTESNRGYWDIVWSAEGTARGGVFEVIKATNFKVLSEEVNSNGASLNHEASPSAPEVPTTKASSKVLITTRPSATESDDSRISTLSAPGDLLGLASYASDDDEKYEIKYTGVPNSKRNTIHQASTTKMLSDELSVGGNDLSASEAN